MNAHIARSMDSASAIAIQTSTSQTISADIIPFPAKACQAEAAPVEVIEELPAVAAHNDNAVAALPPVNPEYGASALIERSRLTRAVEIVTGVVERRNTIDRKSTRLNSSH